MSARQVVPSDSRYIPLTQQKWCCVPACIQMVMLRHKIPLVPQELIGYEMGLIVPEEDKNLFWNVRTGPEPKAGWGTQRRKPQYGPNFVFRKLKIPLKITWSLISKFKNMRQFYEYLGKLVEKDFDVLICFDWKTLYGEGNHGGHVCVLDKIYFDKGEVRIIDPERNVPKWRMVKIDKLYEAMKHHGAQKSGGFWELTNLL